MPSIGESIAAKRHKAARYAQEQHRFTVDRIDVTMTSEHGARNITFQGGAWSCTCPFFALHETCSHVLALELILDHQARLKLADHGRE